MKRLIYAQVIVAYLLMIGAVMLQHSTITAQRARIAQIERACETYTEDVDGDEKTVNDAYERFCTYNER